MHQAKNLNVWEYRVFLTNMLFMHITDALFQNVRDWWKLLDIIQVKLNTLWPPCFQGQGNISLSEGINNKLKENHVIRLIKRTVFFKYWQQTTPHPLRPLWGFHPFPDGITAYICFREKMLPHKSFTHFSVMCFWSYKTKFS